jgi:hypothetical protein
LLCGKLGGLSCGWKGSRLLSRSPSILWCRLTCWPLRGSQGCNAGGRKFASAGLKYPFSGGRTSNGLVVKRWLLGYFDVARVAGVVAPSACFSLVSATRVFIGQPLWTIRNTRDGARNRQGAQDSPRASWVALPCPIHALESSKHFRAAGHRR